jgi:N-acetylneuraminic acid mutarotase
VLGGGRDEDNDGDIVTTANMLKYDSTQDTWIQMAPMPAARWAFASCVVGSEIFVFGGEDAERDPQASVFKYDTVTDEWSTLAPMPQPSHGRCVSVLDGLIYTMGAGTNHCDELRFDSASGAWSTLAITLNCRKGGASFVLGGCLYAAGGMDEGASVERYDVATDTWAAVADMLEERRYLCAAVTGYVGLAEEQDLFDSLIAKASRGHL